MQNTEAPPVYRITSVDHALQLIELMHSQHALRVADAASHLGVARSTAHRLLSMLVFRGFAVQDPRSRLYHSGPRLIEIGANALARLDIRIKARSYLDQLVEQTGETVSLQVLQGRHVLFVDSVESHNTVRVASRTGVLIPAHASSGGKAMLAKLPEELLLQLFPDENLEAVTSATNTERLVLLEELKSVRELGYSVNYGQSEDGLVAVGVAIAGDAGQLPLGAFTAAGPAHRMTVATIGRAVNCLRAASADLAANVHSSVYQNV